MSSHTSRTIEITLGKEYTEAAANHRSETLKAVTAGNTWDVSPMTFKDGLYRCYLTYPKPEPALKLALAPMRFDSGEDLEDETEDDETPDDRLWQHYCALARGLDVDELIATTMHDAHHEAVGEEQNPLRQLLEDWTKTPQFDWTRPLLTPSTAERLGHWLAGLAAQAFHEAVGAAMAEEGD